MKDGVYKLLLLSSIFSLKHTLTVCLWTSLILRRTRGHNVPDYTVSWHPLNTFIRLYTSVTWECRQGFSYCFASRHTTLWTYCIILSTYTSNSSNMLIHFPLLMFLRQYLSSVHLPIQSISSWTYPSEFFETKRFMFLALSE